MDQQGTFTCDTGLDFMGLSELIPANDTDAIPSGFSNILTGFDECNQTASINIPSDLIEGHYVLRFTAYDQQQGNYFFFSCADIMIDSPNHPNCGDGYIISEECDDGPLNLPDTTESPYGVTTNFTFCSDECSTISKFPRYCGNGKIEENEICDDGNNIDVDACSNDCLENLLFCGDGILQNGLGGSTNLGETCDDANNVSNDGCSAECMIESCGDGIRQMKEACDDGEIANGGCDADCKVVQGWECVGEEGEKSVCSKLYTGLTPGQGVLIASFVTITLLGGIVICRSPMIAKRNAKLPHVDPDNVNPPDYSFWDKLLRRKHYRDRTKSTMSQMNSQGVKMLSSRDVASKSVISHDPLSSTNLSDFSSVSDNTNKNMSLLSPNRSSGVSGVSLTGPGDSAQARRGSSKGRAGGHSPNKRRKSGGRRKSGSSRRSAGSKNSRGRQGQGKRRGSNNKANLK